MIYMQLMGTEDNEVLTKNFIVQQKKTALNYNLSDIRL